MFRIIHIKQCLDIKAMGGVGLEKLECRITKKCPPNVKILSDELQKTKLFLDLYVRAHDTDKYNIQCVDKTVLCACISELLASGLLLQSKSQKNKNSLKFC